MAIRMAMTMVMARAISMAMAATVMLPTCEFLYKTLIYFEPKFKLKIN